MPLNPPQAYRKTEFTHRRGERIAQPLATDVLTGTLYYVVDEAQLEISDGTNWQVYSGLSSSTSAFVSYSYSAATGTPPGAQQIRFNAGFPYTAVTKLYIWNITSDGQDIRIGLRRIQPGAVIYVQDKNDNTQWASFQLTTAPTDHTTWVEYDVVHVAHGLAIGGGQLVLVQAGPGPTYAPPPHAPSHETGGSDAIAHLSGGVIDSGTVVDARLSSNVALKNINNAFSTDQAITGLLDLSNAASGQIKFPSTQNPSANLRTLDDYNELGFTPIDVSGAGLVFVGAGGTITKVGRLVTFAVQVQYPVTANGANVAIGGFPFTSGGFNYGATQCFGIQRMWYFPAGTAHVLGLDPATSAGITNAVLSGTIILLVGHYEV